MLPIGAPTSAPYRRSGGPRPMQSSFRIKAALAEAVRRITGPAPGDTDPRPIVTVVLFGDGNFGTNYKGSVPSHYRQLREALHDAPNCLVLNVSEDGTSKVMMS